MSNLKRAPALDRRCDHRGGIGREFERESEREKRRAHGQRDVVQYDVVACGMGLEFDGHRKGFDPTVSDESLRIQGLRA